LLGFSSLKPKQKEVLMKLVLSALVFSFIGLSAQANDLDHLIAKVEVRRVLDTQTFSGGIGAMGCPEKGQGYQFYDETNPIDEAELIVDKIINIGKKVWAIIDAGKPVSNLKYDVATALPQGAKCWLDLQQWQAPKSAAFVVSYKNLYGVELVHLKYRVLYLAGGNVKGVGKYVGYATVQPADIRMSWGYDLDVKAEATAIYNQGTDRSPIGGLQLQITWTLKSVLQNFTQTQVYSINGLGELKSLN
jgi:hypothetical protein